MRQQQVVDCRESNQCHHAGLDRIRRQLNDVQRCKDQGNRMRDGGRCHDLHDGNRNAAPIDPGTIAVERQITATGLVGSMRLQHPRKSRRQRRRHSSLPILQTCQHLELPAAAEDVHKRCANLQTVHRSRRAQDRSGHRQLPVRNLRPNLLPNNSRDRIQLYRFAGRVQSNVPG